MAFLALPRDQRELYDAVGYREKLEAVDEGIRRYVSLY
jgi:carnosine N-methyltransferase